MDVLNIGPKLGQKLTITSFLAQAEVVAIKELYIRTSTFETSNPALNVISCVRDLIAKLNRTVYCGARISF